MRSDCCLLAVAAATWAVALTTSRDAVASPFDRLALHFDAGAGTVITPELRRAGFDAALHTDARLALRVVGPLTINAGASVWLFPAQAGAASLSAPVLGVGLDLPITSGFRIVAAADAGVAVSGGLAHAMIDGSLSFQIELTRWLAFGPYARFARVFSREPEIPVDASLWSAGLAFSFRSSHRDQVPPPPASMTAPDDTDHDGVADARDRCPRIRAGSFPDPERPGCPDGDVDQDGVVDHRDSCRIEPAGPRPDPVWLGCPVADADEDGVPDASDTCRLQPAGRTPDRAWPGCPARDVDHDGVLDDDDLCLETPRGAEPDPDRVGCPDGDADHDGITDHHDECRTVPVGLHVDPSRRGCPASDLDHDSVPDADDHCPTTAGAPNADPRRNGCLGAVRLVDAMITTARPLRFAGSTPTLTAASTQGLRDVATFLAANPAIRRVAIRVAIPLSPTGDEARANALRDARTHVVRFTLVANGVDASRIVIAETSGSASGSPPPSPVVNDVEFRIVDPTVGATP